jgi:BMFP domain-containing protein YqiC
MLSSLRYRVLDSRVASLEEFFQERGNSRQKLEEEKARQMSERHNSLLDLSQKEAIDLIKEELQRSREDNDLLAKRCHALEHLNQELREEIT